MHATRAYIWKQRCNLMDITYEKRYCSIHSYASSQITAPATLPSGKKSSAQWIVHCVGLRASLNILERRKISCWELNPDLFSTWHLNCTTCYSLSNYMTADFRSLHGFKYSHGFTG